MTAYDAIVIGTGQAGPHVTSRLAGAGMKVAVIERNAFGGTCVNTGCIPTKTMVASAYAARMAARAAEYGVDVGSVRVDMKRVMARKDAVSKESRTGLEDWLRNMKNCTVYQGHARFESAHDVNVGGERLHAAKIFINVGGRALVPDMPGLREIDAFTNSSMMSGGLSPEADDAVRPPTDGLATPEPSRHSRVEERSVRCGPRHRVSRCVGVGSSRSRLGVASALPRGHQRSDGGPEHLRAGGATRRPSLSFSLRTRSPAR